MSKQTWPDTAWFRRIDFVMRWIFPLVGIVISTSVIVWVLK